MHYFIIILLLLLLYTKTKILNYYIMYHEAGGVHALLLQPVSGCMIQHFILQTRTVLGFIFYMLIYS